MRKWFVQRTPDQFPPIIAFGVVVLAAVVGSVLVWFLNRPSSFEPRPAVPVSVPLELELETDPAAQALEDAVRAELEALELERRLDRWTGEVTQHVFATESQVSGPAPTFEGASSWSIWNVTVNPLADVTRLVGADETVGGFAVEMVLASTGRAPIAPASVGRWGVVGGATGILYETQSIDCGGSDGAFADNQQVFPGGSITGVVCVPMDEEDVDHPVTAIVLDDAQAQRRHRFDSATVTQPAVADIRTDLGILEVLGPATPARVATELEFESRSVLGHRHRWTVEAGSFSVAPSPIDDGLVNASFEVSVQVIESDGEVMPGGSTMSFEVIGGSSLRVYDQWTRGSEGCEPLPETTALAEGDRFDGTICIAIPTADAEHPDTRISVNALGERVTFATS